jgi:hypothetical protein
MFKLSAIIKSHPRLENGVEVHIENGDREVEYFTIIKDTIEQSIEQAKQTVRNLFPELGEGDVSVQLSSSIERD